MAFVSVFLLLFPFSSFAADPVSSSVPAVAAPAAPERAASPVMVPPTEPATPSTTSEAASPDNSGEYEIDYEEEPGAVAEPEESGDDSAEEAPQKKKKNRGKKVDRSVPSYGSAVSGTRSKNKFAPIMNSEAKSIYHKNGKALDVDTD